MTIKRFALVCALIVGSALGIRGSVAEHSAHLSDDLLAHRTRLTIERTRVIVHGDAAQVAALAARHHLQVLRQLSNEAVVAANSLEIAELAADGAIDHLSGDPIVRTSMSVSNKAIAADQARAGAPGLLGIGAIPGVTGQGVGVAVIDSGISPHAALTGKVVANVSLVTGDPSTADAYGHGTHIAGIIAGSGAAARNVTGLYDGGVAPGVQLVNVRVLGADGSGLTSDVIAGIQWAVANRARYNIRIINLSLGHPVGEPAATDPLCEAVADAVQAGIVVVAAAGNAGVADNGSQILGGIMSPGNSPAAITVGALNTWGTADRSDDTVATYSSRGPTKYDLAVKPDVAAPGNKIISLEANGGYLVEEYSVPAPGRLRLERLHAVERHQHGRTDGQRRRRPAAARHAQPGARAGQAGASDGRDLREGRRPDGRRCRQRQRLGGAENRRQRARRPAGLDAGRWCPDSRQRCGLLGLGLARDAAVSGQRAAPAVARDLDAGVAQPVAVARR